MSLTSVEEFYRTNEAGQRVKVTRKVITELTPVESTVGRGGWKPYGIAAAEKRVPQKSDESITLRLTPKSGGAKKEPEPAPKNTMRNVRCHVCNASHLSIHCPHKNTLVAGEGGMLGAKDLPGRMGAAVGGAPGAPGKYVPPSLRNAMSGVNGMGVPGMGVPGMGMGHRARSEGSTLRVSNIAQGISEQDLRQNFSRYGRVLRCHLPFDRETMKTRGFAFIEFETREQAEKARELDGVAAKNQILRVDFAQSRD